MLFNAVKEGTWDDVERLIIKLGPENNTLGLVAIQSGRVQIAQKLLDVVGVDAHAYNGVFLILASRSGNVSMVKLLL